MGGFECATHRRRDRLQIDVAAATLHDRMAASDYAMLADVGVRSVRDGLRWHLIEREPGQYDWSSFLSMLQAAHMTGTQVVWDLCHWGMPADVDIFAEGFPERFAAFSRAAATVVREFNDRHAIARPPIYCPINEMSFWSWVGGDVEHFHPYGDSRGPELKRQLVRASVAAIRVVRQVDPGARFLHAEPIIHISADPGRPEDEEFAARHTAAQYEAWDMLAGRQAPELGGSEDCLDIVGANYYWNNQWIHGGAPTPPGHFLHRPLHDTLSELWTRYQRPLIVAETGCEGSAAFGWLGYVCSEVRQAQRMRVPVEGICLYPVMDYPGWDDERHCGVGLIETTADWSKRSLRLDLCEELQMQAALFAR